jgi:hypothetical protein
MKIIFHFRNASSEQILLRLLEASDPDGAETVKILKALPQLPCGEFFIYFKSSF